jgi:hypothetical protein
VTAHGRGWHLDHAEKLLLGAERVCKDFHRLDPEVAVDAFPSVRQGLGLSLRRVEAHLKLAELLADDVERVEPDAVKAKAETALHVALSCCNQYTGVCDDNGRAVHELMRDHGIEPTKQQPDTEATEQPADEYWCGTCKETFSPLDHYHCVKCKALTGMTGHPNGCPTPYGPAPMVPRVWRKGDEPPPFDVKKVRHDNSQVFTRVGPNGWRAGVGALITGEQLLARLIGGYKLTEVIEDGAL